MTENCKEILPVLTLRDTIVFPQTVIPLFIGREKSVLSLDHSAKYNNYKILLITQTDGSIDNPSIDNLYKVGVVADIVQLLKLPDETVKILIRGENRAKVFNFIEEGSLLKAEVEIIPVKDEIIDEKLEALRRSVLVEFDIWNKLSKKIQAEAVASVYEIKELSHLTDIITSHLGIKIADKQKILETFDLTQRLEELYNFIKLEISVLNAQKKIRNRVKAQVENTQRVYYLNEQLKAIQKELEESDNAELDSASDFEKRIENTKLSKEAKEKALSELRRYKKMSSMSPEATIISTYLNCLLDLPWGKNTEAKINIDRSIKILDNNHYGILKVKERIIEFLAVLKRVKKLKGSILCFVGPPGVGKTSLAKSIAEATGRKFVSMSLGGLRDESEIRGHRKTYVGAMPGRIIQQLKNSKTSNPLFLLDEIDKLGSDYRGDPSFALLEVLDPEHNKAFVDNYIEVPFDLSDVMFIATANSLNLPKPLIDRMEIIQLSGYTEDEKLQITKQHLIPTLSKDHGLLPKEFNVTDEALYKLIRNYTRESGVRNLKREIANLMRKTVKEIFTNKDIKSITIDKDNIENYSGISKYSYGVVEEHNLVGMVTGLAYTETGGDILIIESVSMPGKGMIKYTGKLGEVMQESVKTAYSYIRSRCLFFGITTKKFQTNDIHIHVPEGAIPKDGPSAGVAMCTSIVSLLTNIPVDKTIAMTGEVTFRGRVLPIGGLKEKLLAALRGGIKTIILPKLNEKDIKEIPENVKYGLRFIFVTTIEEVIKAALVKQIIPIKEDVIEATANNSIEINNQYDSTDLTQH